MARSSPYDWIKIKKEYVQGFQIRDAGTGELRQHFPSQDELAEKYGCHHQTLKKKAADELWYNERLLFRQKLQYKSSEVDLKDLVGWGGELDNKILRVADNILGILSDEVRHYNEAINNFDPEQQDQFDPSERVAPTSKQIKDWTSALKDVHVIKAKIFGEDRVVENLTEVVRQEMTQGRVKGSLTRSKRNTMHKLLTQAENLVSIEKQKQELADQINRLKAQLNGDEDAEYEAKTFNVQSEEILDK